MFFETITQCDIENNIIYVKRLLKGLLLAYNIITLCFIPSERDSTALERRITTAVSVRRFFFFCTCMLGFFFSFSIVSYQTNSTTSDESDRQQKAAAKYFSTRVRNEEET